MYLHFVNAELSYHITLLKMCFYANIFEHAHATKLYGGFYYKIVRVAHYQTIHSGGRASNFVGRGFCPFFNYQTARGEANHSDVGCCDLDHSCFILYKSRDLLIA